MTTRLRILVVGIAALVASSCSLWLEVEGTRSTQETVREPLGTVERVSANLIDDGLQIAVQRHERTRVTTYAVESSKRSRRKLTDSQASGVFVLDFLVPILPLIDIGLGVSAMFRDDVDVALGPLGFLAAVVVPGVTLAKGHSYEDWDTTTTRRVLSTQEVEGDPVGVSATLNVRTDLDVLRVETDSLGTATIPLAQLRNASGAFGRIAIACGDAVYTVQIADGTVRCTEVTR